VVLFANKRYRRRVVMTSVIGSFCKRGDCPASDRILAFQTGSVEVAISARIRDHLRDCEFCAAEVEFYRYYPPACETVVVEKMPQPLFELANALLRNKRDLSPLYRLIETD